MEDIVPATPGVLRVYACGPTVYKPQHVGNLRSALLPDLIGRVAMWHGLQVRYVQNVTDVGHLSDDGGEDKMVTEARARGLTPLEVAREIEALFHSDASALGFRPAEANPRATDYVGPMIALTQRLIDGGYAYPDGGSVFFAARSFPTYGEVSGNRLADLKPAASGRLTDAEESLKRFHADWALWRGNAAPGADELSFDSPWGPGTPGWHIECSAMSLDLLGETIDVHTGGIDLRFPHHEDERAQSVSAVGHEVVRHWVHGEHLLFEGRKMAKSTGNVVLLCDVEARGYDPLALRLAFLQGHYRQQMNLSWDAIAAAEKTLQRWRLRVAEWAQSPSKAMPAGYVGRVADAFAADLDTPSAVIAMRDLERDPAVPAGAKFEAFAHLDRLFGLDLARDVGRPRSAPPLPPGAKDLLDRRAAARSAKDFATSDALRAELSGLGVTVVDTAAGQTW